MTQYNNLLLIIYVENHDALWLWDSLKKVLNSSDYSDFDIDIMPVTDLCDEDISSKTKSISCCRSVKIVDTLSYFNKTKTGVIDDLNMFVSDLREQILSLAQNKIGAKWVKRFGELWWYTLLSEKNSHGEPLWWIFYYFEAACLRMKEKRYKKCIFLGANEMGSLLIQHCRREQIDFDGQTLNRTKKSFFQLILIRFMSGLNTLLIVITSYLMHGRNKHNVISKNNSSNIFLLYSFYPRAWIKKSGTWQDRYLGEIFNKTVSHPPLEPVYVLYVLGRNNVVFFKYFIERFKKLRNKKTQPKNFIVLESFTNPLHVLKEHLNFKDVLYYWYIARSDNFKKLFVWKGNEIYDIFSYRMWKSAIIWWPSMLVMEKCAQNIALKMKPSLTSFIGFEYIDGRAFVNGTRASASGKIIGIQHGPMTPLKMMYSGTPAELRATQDGGIQLPEPDIYSVDGPLTGEILKNRGIDKDRIKEIGPARFDDLWLSAKKAAQRPRFESKKVTILLAPGFQDTEFTLRFVLKALSEDSRLRIIIKVHPRVNSVNLNRILRHNQSGQDSGAEVEIALKGGIYPYMESADIMLTTYSSTGVEAISFGLAVILIVLKNIPDMSPLSFDGSNVLTASTQEALRKHINILIKDSFFRKNYQTQLQKVVSKNFGNIDSHAADRMVKLCLSQIPGQSVII